MTSLIFALFGISTAQAEFGTYQPTVGFEQSYEESMDVVEASRKLRKSIKMDRSIAGMTTSDEKWAEEFDKIMADNKTDYLKKAYQLND